MYKGSSKDTPWNKDLLWRLYVEAEARKMGFALPEGPHDVDNQPPFMKPLAAAINKDFPSIPLYDPYTGDYFKTNSTLLVSGRPNEPIEAKAGPRALDHPAALAKSASAGAFATTGGGGGGGGSATGGAGSAALASSRSSSRFPPLASSRAGGDTSRTRYSSLRRDLDSERRQRQETEGKLHAELAAERRKRAAVESEVKAFEERVSATMKAHSRDAEKVKAYEKIVQTLVSTLQAKSARK